MKRIAKNSRTNTRKVRSSISVPNIKITIVSLDLVATLVLFCDGAEQQQHAKACICV